MEINAKALAKVSAKLLPVPHPELTQLNIWSRAKPWVGPKRARAPVEARAPVACMDNLI